jgi:hypothetical protein
MAKKVNFSDEQIKSMIHKYTVEYKGSPTIAEEMGTTKYLVNKALKENGVEMGSSGRKWKGGKKESDKRYYQKNKGTLSEYHKEWSKENRGRLREYHSKWRDDNRETLRENQRNSERERVRNNPKYRLTKNIRSALSTSIKEMGAKKNKKTFDILGYTPEDLMQHLEKRFYCDMTWYNYGEWHVDHIKPISSFDYESVDDIAFKECWSLNNLQPLWAKENLQKGSKFNDDNARNTTILSEKDIEDIVNLYKSGELKSIKKLSIKFSIGNRRVKNILLENDVNINDPNRGKLKRKETYRDLQKKYKSPPEGMKYIMVCKKTGIEFSNVLNVGGVLTNHIKKYIPESEFLKMESYGRKIQSELDGELWYEKYFDILIK